MNNEMETPVTEDVINRTLHEWMERGCWHVAHIGWSSLGSVLRCEGCGIVWPLDAQVISPNYCADLNAVRGVELKIIAEMPFGRYYAAIQDEIRKGTTFGDDLLAVSADVRALVCYRLIQQSAIERIPADAEGGEDK